MRIQTTAGGGGGRRDGGGAGDGGDYTPVNALKEAIRGLRGDLQIINEALRAQAPTAFDDDTVEY